VILDVEGSAAQQVISPRLGQMLSIASAAVAAAALLIVSALPHEAPSRAVESGPSILEQALARPTPQRLNLVLPAEIAVPLSQIGTQDGTGNGRSAITPRSFRLRATSDVLSVVPVPNAAPITAPTQRPADALAVHGNYAQWWTIEPTSVSVLRWTEDGTTYEISSRTLTPKDLARIADLLH
jgi:hypothetical protein